MSFFFFFFKQKTAYEISACLVGSEMCIRDRTRAMLRELQLVAARGLARKALGLASAAEVRALVEAEVQ